MKKNTTTIKISNKAHEKLKKIKKETGISILVLSEKAILNLKV